MQQTNGRFKRALPALAIASVLVAGAAPISAVGRQEQPPVTQPPSPRAQQPPSTPPAPQVPAPAQVPQPTPAPATPAPPAPQPPAAATTGQPHTPNEATPGGSAVTLLDRIADLVDQALGEKTEAKRSDKGTPGTKGTTGVMKVGKTNAGTVSIDRAALDEIKAEVEQLKVMLKDKDKKP